jgi:hypothetical protein
LQKALAERAQARAIVGARAAGLRERRRAAQAQDEQAAKNMHQNGI